ncbi:MAG: Rrf2 family transcriptional regulator [Candidatus Methylacidiphilales bacterium]|nr:Rrf2 family transcriptional regulator [Candidatus Methylacidiphilales bacterium]
MRVSKKSEYAVRALLEIALGRLEGREWRQISQIAEATRIPEKFLEQILLALKKRGLLQSRRGVIGGYALAVEPGAIRLDEVIQILDGETSGEATDPAGDIGARVFRRLLARSEDAALEVLRGVTLAQLVEEAHQMRSSPSGMDYHI